MTIYSFLPNTRTVTLTTTPSVTQTFAAAEEFSTPSYCASVFQGPGRLTELRSTTAYVTAKSAPTVYTTASPVTFPGVKTDKVSITPGQNQPISPASEAQAQTTDSSSNPEDTPSGNTGNLNFGGSSSGGTSAGSDSGSSAGSGSSSGSGSDRVGGDSGTGSSPTSSAVVSGVSVALSPSQAVIGSHTIDNIGSTSTVVTADGQKFTVNPSQVVGPGTTFAIPSSAGAAAATPTVLKGVSITVGSSSAVIGGKTYAIGIGAPITTIVDHGKTISVGPGGVGMSDTVVSPQSAATNYAVVGASPISAIGSTLAVIDGHTLTYGSNIPAQTSVFNGVTITVEPSGIDLPQTTIGGKSNSGLQLGLVGGVSITEVGSSVAIISKTTFTIGPGATQTTAVISGEMISAGANGLGVHGTVLSYPFNPMTTTITAGGITFAEIGSTLAVIDGTTFTFGNGASVTSDVVSGQTISIGPGGLGFASTTFRGAAATSTQSGKHNGAVYMRPVYGLMGLCIAIGVGILV